MSGKRSIGWSTLVLCAVAMALPAWVFAAEAAGKFSNGLKFKSEDGAFEFQPNGRLHFDYNMLDGDDDIGAIDDGLEFRRLYLGVNGKLYGNVDFKLLFDFAGTKVSYRDAYLGLTTPAFRVRVGQFYQPFGMETQTSDNYMPFIERGQQHALSPDRQSGFMIFRGIGEGDGTISVSGYQENSGDGKNLDTGYWSGAGRVTLVPAGAPDEKFLLHIGAAMANRRNAEQAMKLELKPEANLAPAFSAGTIAAESWNQLGLESAVIYGPLSATVEAVLVSTTAPEGLEDASINCVTAQCSYFLTGEKRNYNASTGLHDRIATHSNYDGKGGMGAFELVARFSRTDADDDAVAAGTMTAISAGANWYLNPQARVMVNYVRSEGEGTTLEGVIDAYLARFQVDF